MAEGLLRTVLVDDEPVARRTLAEELAEIAGVAVVGQADNGEAAVELINAQRPDLVLLDIQMPVWDGFEVVRRLERLPPAVVFVTAYDQHALRAFEAGAADYLLKPVGHARLREAVSKARLAARHPVAGAETLARTLDAEGSSERRRVVGRKGDEYFLIDLSEVLAFRAEGDLVWILTNEKQYLAGHTIQEMASRLRGGSFRRIHRSAVINMDHVRKMTGLSSQRWMVTMSNGMELVVSKRQAHAIRELLRG